MNDFWGVLMVLMILCGVLLGALAVIIFQRRKGGRTVAQEAEDYRQKAEEQRKAETVAARTEK